MKKKFLIPVMAMVFAIGMAFTNVDTAMDGYAEKYIRVDNTWRTVEVDCGTKTAECLVMFSEDPSATPHRVYNSRNLNDPALGTGVPTIIDGPVPSN